MPRQGEEGCGRVFVKYADEAGAAKCKAKVDGRKFGDNVVKPSSCGRLGSLDMTLTNDIIYHCLHCIHTVDVRRDAMS